MITTTTAADSRTAGTTASRSTWALWGVAAGVTGILTNLVFAPTVGDEIRSAEDPAGVLAELSRGSYHLSAITGFLTVAFLIFFAAGLARWARNSRQPRTARPGPSPPARPDPVASTPRSPAQSARPPSRRTLSGSRTSPRSRVPQVRGSLDLQRALGDVRPAT